MGLHAHMNVCTCFGRPNTNQLNVSEEFVKNLSGSFASGFKKLVRQINCDEVDESIVFMVADASHK